jgi:hypothetical protein
VIISDAVAAVNKAITVEDLKLIKTMQPDYIIRDPSFIEAATRKYHLIMAENTAA